MNWIERMVAEMCPDGVEYRPLGEVGVFIRGNGIQKSDFVDEGVAAVHYGQIHTRFGISTDHAVSKVPAEMARRLRHVEYGDLLIATTSEDDDAVGKATAWLGLDDCVIGGDAYIYRHSLDPKYMSHFFASVEFQTRKKKYLTGTKVRRISDASLSRILIPVPPIEIQREIVDILDSFTRLEAELEAELEARKAQYVFYRDKLLNFDFVAEEAGVDPACCPPFEVRWLLVGDVLSLKAGDSLPAGKISKVPIIGRFPCFGANGLRGFVGSSNVEVDSVLVGRQGALSGNVQFAKAPFFATEHALVAYPRIDVNVRWLYHELSVLDLGQYVTKSAQPGLSARRLERVKIPVPPLEVQRRIADVLDDFDALVNDLSSGLPAEIAARRQQYEYYRDRLLTFPEKK